MQGEGRLLKADGSGQRGFMLRDSCESGYPPDKPAKVTETVLEQTGPLSGEWAVAGAGCPAAAGGLSTHKNFAWRARVKTERVDGEPVVTAIISRSFPKNRFA